MAMSKDGGYPSPGEIPPGKAAVWVAGHYRLVSANGKRGKASASSAAVLPEPKRRGRPRKDRVEAPAAVVKGRSVSPVVAILVAAGEPGADRAAKARATKALNREVSARVAKGGTEKSIRAGILSRVARIRNGKL